MKKYTLGTISDFKCIGSRCPYNCCKYSWNINIDDKTMEYYKALQGGLGDTLRSNIEIQENKACFKRTSEGKCFFLNNDSLCDLQLKLGHEKLCFTCREYPRFNPEVIPGHSISILRLSCPEVSRLWFSSTNEMILNVMDDRHTTNKKRQIKFDNIMIGFKTTLSILTNREMDISSRLRLIVFFNDIFENHLKNDKNTADIANIFSDINQQLMISSNLEKIEANPLKLQKWFLKLCEIYIENHNDPIMVLFISLVDTIHKSKNQELPDVEESIKLIKSDEMQILYEKLLGYYLFSYYLFSEYDYGIIFRLKRIIHVYICNYSFCYT